MLNSGLNLWPDLEQGMINTYLNWSIVPPRSTNFSTSEVVTLRIVGTSAYSDDDGFLQVLRLYKQTPRGIYKLEL